MDGWKENSIYFQQNTFSYEKNEVLSFEAGNMEKTEDIVLKAQGQVWKD